MPGKTTLTFSRDVNELTMHFVLDRDGDGQFVVMVRADGFSGHGLGFFTAEDLARFTLDMAEAARLMRGEARLDSADESGIFVRLAPSALRGHYAVEGHVSTIPLDQSQRFKQALSFIFEIDAAQIAAASQRLTALAKTSPARERM